VGVDIPLDQIQRIADDTKPYEDASSVVFSNDGTVAAYPDPSAVGKNMRETEAALAGPYLDGYISAVRNGTEYTFSNTVPGAGIILDVFITPITIGQIKTSWALAVGVLQATVRQPVNDMLIIALSISFGVLAAIVVGAVFLSRSISKPIVRVADVLKDIAQGEGDLTRTIDANSKDEIGRMAKYFNQTLEKIRNLVASIKREAAVLSNIGSDLASNMNETAAAVNEITANIQSIKGRIINQSASVTETHATMENLIGNIRKLDGHVEKQSSNISMSSSSIEQMVANIRSVTETLVKNGDNVKTLQDSSEIGRSGLQEVSEDIQEIARESEGYWRSTP
jgi:methyl-accepting chemotaxis protein